MPSRDCCGTVIALSFITAYGFTCFAARLAVAEGPSEKTRKDNAEKAH
jgi:hypothetical protein